MGDPALFAVTGFYLWTGHRAHRRHFLRASVRREDGEVGFRVHEDFKDRPAIRGGQVVEVPTAVLTANSQPVH